MESDLETDLEKIKKIEESLNTLSTVTLPNGKKVSFYAINTSTYRRAQALIQVPEQNIFSEPETTGWIDEFSKGCTLLDIGANVGTYSVYAAIVKGVKVYAFEPSSPNFYLLNRNIQVNNISNLVTAFPLALSNENKTDFLYMPNLNIGQSGNTAGQDTDWLLQEQNSEVKQAAVIASIDQLIKDRIITPPNHIKIDVDGIEPKIIKGATKLLSSGKVESILIELVDHLPEHSETIRALNAYGYEHSLEETEKNRVKDPYWKGLCNYIFRLRRQ